MSSTVEACNHREMPSDVVAGADRRDDGALFEMRGFHDPGTATGACRMVGPTDLHHVSVRPTVRGCNQSCHAHSRQIRAASGHLGEARQCSSVASGHTCICWWEPRAPWLARLGWCPWPAPVHGRRGIVIDWLGEGVLGAPRATGHRSTGDHDAEVLVSDLTAMVSAGLVAVMRTLFAQHPCQLLVTCRASERPSWAPATRARKC